MLYVLRSSLPLLLYTHRSFLIAGTPSHRGAIRAGRSLQDLVRRFTFTRLQNTRTDCRFSLRYPNVRRVRRTVSYVAPAKRQAIERTIYW